MFREGEWTRSRYWLAHFLRSRHERARIQFPAGGAPLCPAAMALLCDVAADPTSLRGVTQDAWLVAVLAHGETADPSFVQAVRLFVRERAYHRQLAEVCLAADGPSYARMPSGLPVLAALALRRLLGPRFELASVWLGILLRQELFEAVVQMEQEPARMAMWRQLAGDGAAHLVFVRERLTMAFAEFNFLRRNLRRWRLRGLFVLSLGWLVLCRGTMVRDLAGSRRRFVTQAVRRFADELQRMVPYHREELLGALLAQRERPFHDAV